MTPLSLIHIVNVDGLGGTGATAFRLARLLAGRGHRVLFCVRPGSVWIDLAAQTGLEISTELALEAGFRPAGFLRDLRTLRRMVRERGAQIVHVHRSAEYWRAALVLGSRRDGSPGRPKLVRSRGVVTPIAPHAVNRWLHNRRTDLVVCTAGVIRDMYQSLPGFAPDCVQLLHDGVDTREFRPGLPDGPAVRAELGILPDAPVVAAIARLAPVKGHRHLAEAAREIAARHPEVRFLLAGRPMRSDRVEVELRARIRELGIERNFVFAGSRTDIPRLLAASDAFVLTSVGSEGSSRATLEAMAAGLPVVASAISCLPDLVADGETGFLVPPADPPALADRLGRLLADPEMRRRMGAAGRRRAESLFDEQRVAENMERLYSRLLAGEPRGS